MWRGSLRASHKERRGSAWSVYPGQMFLAATWRDYMPAGGGIASFSFGRRRAALIGCHSIEPSPCFKELFMNRITRGGLVSAAATGLVLLAATAAEARFIRPDLEKVPVDK